MEKSPSVEEAGTVTVTAETAMAKRSTTSIGRPPPQSPKPPGLERHPERRLDRPRQQKHWRRLGRRRSSRLRRKSRPSPPRLRKLGRRRRHRRRCRRLHRRRRHQTRREPPPPRHEKSNVIARGKPNGASVPTKCINFFSSSSVCRRASAVSTRSTAAVAGRGCRRSAGRDPPGLAKIPATHAHTHMI
jgi:hypothetical protein